MGPVPPAGPGQPALDGALGRRPDAGLQAEVLVAEELRRGGPQLLQLRADVPEDAGLRESEQGGLQQDGVLREVYCASDDFGWEVHFAVQEAEGRGVLCAQA